MKKGGSLKSPSLCISATAPAQNQVLQQLENHIRNTDWNLTPVEKKREDPERNIEAISPSHLKTRKPVQSDGSALLHQQRRGEEKESKAMASVDWTGRGLESRDRVRRWRGREAVTLPAAGERRSKCRCKAKSRSRRTSFWAKTFCNEILGQKA